MTAIDILMPLFHQNKLDYHVLNPTPRCIRDDGLDFVRAIRGGNVAMTSTSSRSARNSASLCRSLTWDIQTSIRQVPNPWREAEAQQVHQPEHMIRKTHRVGVMFNQVFHCWITWDCSKVLSLQVMSLI